MKKLLSKKKKKKFLLKRKFTNRKVIFSVIKFNNKHHLSSGKCDEDKLLNWLDAISIP